MAIAQKITRAQGVSLLNATLISAAGAVGNGEWIDARGLTSYNIHVSGITTATVVVNGSNDDTKPSDATHDIQLGTSFTADGMKQFTTSVKWIKARVSAWTAGSITAVIEGQYGH